MNVEFRVVLFSPLSRAREASKPQLECQSAYHGRKITDVTAFCIIWHVQVPWRNICYVLTAWSRFCCVTKVGFFPEFRAALARPRPAHQRCAGIDFFHAMKFLVCCKYRCQFAFFTLWHGTLGDFQSQSFHSDLSREEPQVSIRVSWSGHHLCPAPFIHRDVPWGWT